MYAEPPNDELSLDEFEMFALDRLAVLRGIDDMLVCGLGQGQLDEQLWALVESKIPMRSRRTPGWKDDLRKDTASHFILRLAHFRTEELRLWFLEQEAYLLRARLERLNEDAHTSGGLCTACFGSAWVRDMQCRPVGRPARAGATACRTSCTATTKTTLLVRASSRCCSRWCACT